MGTLTWTTKRGLDVGDTSRKNGRRTTSPFVGLVDGFVELEEGPNSPPETTCKRPGQRFGAARHLPRGPAKIWELGTPASRSAVFSEGFTQLLLALPALNIRELFFLSTTSSAVLYICNILRLEVDVDGSISGFSGGERLGIAGPLGSAACYQLHSAKMYSTEPVWWLQNGCLRVRDGSRWFSGDTVSKMRQRTTQALRPNKPTMDLGRMAFQERFFFYKESFFSGST